MVGVGAAWGLFLSQPKPALTALRCLPAASLRQVAHCDLRRVLWALHLLVALPVSSLLHDRGAGGLGISPHIVFDLAMESGRRGILHSLVQIQSVPSAQLPSCLSLWGGPLGRCTAGTAQCFPGVTLLLGLPLPAWTLCPTSTGAVLACRLWGRAYTLLLGAGGRGSTTTPVVLTAPAWRRALWSPFYQTELGSRGVPLTLDVLPWI